MASRLIGAKPLPEPMLTYLSIGPLGTNFGEIWIGTSNFHSLICIWKCRLRNGGHLAQGDLRYKTVLSENKTLLSWKCIQNAVLKMPTIGSVIPVSNYFVQHLTTYSSFWPTILYRKVLNVSNKMHKNAIWEMSAILCMPDYADVRTQYSDLLPTRSRPSSSGQ